MPLIREQTFPSVLATRIAAKLRVEGKVFNRLPMASLETSIQVRDAFAPEPRRSPDDSAPRSREDRHVKMTCARCQGRGGHFSTRRHSMEVQNCWYSRHHQTGWGIQKPSNSAARFTQLSTERELKLTFCSWQLCPWHPEGVLRQFRGDFASVRFSESCKV